MDVAAQKKAVNAAGRAHGGPARTVGTVASVCSAKRTLKLSAREFQLGNPSSTDGPVPGDAGFFNPDRFKLGQGTVGLGKQMTPEKKLAGYMDHKPGSRKGDVHRVFDEQGHEAAVAHGEKLGLKPNTLKAWIATWKRAEKAADHATPEPSLIRKLFKELIKAELHKFPDHRGRLVAPNEPGVYIIYGPDGRVLHVGRSTRGRAGIRQRLNNHLHAASSFALHHLNGDGSLLRVTHSYRYLVVEDPRQRALLEALAVGRLCPVHLGLGDRLRSLPE